MHRRFAFVERAGSAVCLICNDRIAPMKQSNVKQHFDKHHASHQNIPRERAERRRGKSRVQASQQQLLVWTRQGDYNLKTN